MTPTMTAPARRQSFHLARPLAQSVQGWNILFGNPSQFFDERVGYATKTCRSDSTRRPRSQPANPFASACPPCDYHHAEAVTCSFPWNIFCIEEAGIGFGPQYVKKILNKYEKIWKYYEFWTPSRSKWLWRSKYWKTSHSENLLILKYWKTTHFKGPWPLKYCISTHF